VAVIEDARVTDDNSIKSLRFFSLLAIIATKPSVAAQSDNSVAPTHLLRSPSFAWFAESQTAPPDEKLFR
jgi:hypothetical protein